MLQCFTEMWSLLFFQTAENCCSSKWDTSASHSCGKLHSCLVFGVLLRSWRLWTYWVWALKGISSPLSVPQSCLHFLCGILRIFWFLLLEFDVKGPKFGWLVWCLAACSRCLVGFCGLNISQCLWFCISCSFCRELCLISFIAQGEPGGCKYTSDPKNLGAEG